MEYTFYRIYSKNPAITECYIGSTKDFEVRKRIHKSRCNNINDPSYNLKVYQYIRSNGGFDEFDFEIIDTITFSKTDRFIHENKLMDLYGSTLNTRRTIITVCREEYNRQYRETHKKYEEFPKERLNSNQNKKIVCEVCGGKYTLTNKSHHLKTNKHIINKTI